MIAKFIRIQMPFSDIRRLIAVFVETIGERLMIGIDSDLIDHHTRTRSILPRKQRRAERRAHGMPRHGVAKIGGVFGHCVHDRRLGSFIAAVTRTA